MRKVGNNPQEVRRSRRYISPGFLAVGLVLLILAGLMAIRVRIYTPTPQRLEFESTIDRPAETAIINASPAAPANQSPRQHHSGDRQTKGFPQHRHHTNQLSSPSPSPTPTATSTLCVTPTPKATAQKRSGVFKRVWNFVKRLFGGRRQKPAQNSSPIVCSLNTSSSTATITQPCPIGPSAEGCVPSPSSEIQLTADARDPDNDTLLYTWSVTGGRISGEGRTVTWDLSGVNPGNYTASVEVNDGNQHTASASTTVTVTECPCAPPACPNISVSCPSYIEEAQPITFTASATGAGLTPTYNWSVSAGTISSGQGTSSITVDTTGAAGQTVTATVEVGGIGPACSKSASCSTKQIKFDEYGNIRSNEEKARLDNYAIQLQNQPGSTATIIAYGTCAGEGQARADHAKNYLVNTRGIEASRITAIDGGCRSDLKVELWVVPSDASAPSANGGEFPCRECPGKGRSNGDDKTFEPSSLAGNVRGPTGEAIAQAPVTIIGSNGFRRTIKTDENGNFRFQDLPPGTYRLEIRAQGFGPLTAPDIVLEEGQDLLLPPLELSPEARTIRFRERDLIRVTYPDHFLDNPAGEITFSLDRRLGESEIEASETNANGKFEIIRRAPSVPSSDLPYYRVHGSQYTAFATVTLVPTGLTVVSAPSTPKQSLKEKPVVWTWKVKPTDPSAEVASFRFHVDIVWQAEGLPDKPPFSYDWKETFSGKIGPPKSVKAAKYGSPVFAAFGLMTLGFGFGKRKKLFAELERAAVPGSAAKFEELEEEVSSSVFAPRQAAPGGAFIVHVFAHRPDVDAESLRASATEAEPKTQRVGTDLLEQRIRQGATLTFRLSMEGLEIDDPQQSRVWTGRTIRVQFGVKVPKDSEPREMFGLVVICEDTMPVGHFRFKFEIVRSLAEASGVPLQVDAIERYNKAFVSYAHEDRAEVLKRVQMLSILKQKYFQDFISLRPGDKWEPSIYEAIDRSDVVYLFWSTAASGSEFVKKEILRAVERRAGDENAPPAIYPVIIEGPPPADPPAELSFLQFDDKFSYWIFAAEGSSQRKDT